MKNSIRSIILAGLACSGHVQASEMFVGWTKTSWGPPMEPSLQLPGLAGFNAQLTEIDISGSGNKWDRGSSDLSFGSQYSGLADEEKLHETDTTFSIAQTDFLRMSVTNNTGEGSSVIFDTVLADATSPFSTSPEILKITYAEGGLGLAPGTVLGLWTNTPNSGLTGYADYDDFDADLTSLPVADRTLANGQHAVFEITVSGGAGATYVDNMAVSGSYNPPPSSAETITVAIDPSNSKWVVSDHMIGAHTVYYNDVDEAYADGTLADWFRQAGIATMRFPGGSVVKYWDWESPSGTATGDPWDPAWDGVVANSNDWMSLDEYLDFCDISEIKPLVGVNYRSGYLYNRMQDSIDRAARCVQYVVDRGYPGAFWYIGNEDMFQVGGVYSSATNFIAHAAAMKAVDPTIRIFWNDNVADPQRMKDWLGAMHTDQATYPGKAGDYTDGYEFHGKWPFGGDPDPAPLPGSYEEWKTEVPLIDRKADNNAGKTWREKIADLRLAAIEVGYPDLLLANNEYGWGNGENFSGFNKYTSGLLMIDFLQEHFISGYDMACFWANIRGADSGLLDGSGDYRRNPQTLGWELLAEAQGATMLESSSSHSNVYGFSAATTNQILLYLLNKTESDQEISVSFASAGADANELATGVSLVDAIGQWGTNVAFSVSYNAASNSYTATLPALSYNRISFAKAALPTHEEIQSLDSGNWTNASTWSTGEVPDYLDRVLLKFKDVVTVDSLGNQAGNLRIDGGQAYLDIAPGGSLEVVENGAYPTNGAVSFKAATSALGLRLQGGSLSVDGSFAFGAGGSGITNLFSVSSGTLELNGFTTIGTVGSGNSLLDIVGDVAGFSVGGNLELGPGSILRWTATAAGTATPIVSGNLKSVTLAGALIADLSALTNTPAEIVLIDNDGGDAIIGAFTSTNMVGTSGYSLSHTGGDGNDLSLVYSGSAYDAWAQSYNLFGGQSDDDDGDLLNNLSEYGLGGDPTNPADIGILPTFGNAGSMFEYIYPRRTALDSGLLYYLELTDNLISGVWTNAGYTEPGAGTINPEFEAVTNLVPTTGKANEFIRLKIIAD